MAWGVRAIPEELPDKFGRQRLLGRDALGVTPELLRKMDLHLALRPRSRVGGRPSLLGKLRGAFRAPAGFHVALRQGGLRYVVGMRGDHRV